MQLTIERDVAFEGVGLHGGREVSMRVRPAPANSGIVFQLEGERVRADFSLVEHRPLCTLLCSPSGVRISTVEHFMAAAGALGLDNLLVELSSDELPILDGSARIFVEGLTRAGRMGQDVPRRVARILRPVFHHEGDAACAIWPAEKFSAHVEIDFDNPGIGRQQADFSGGYAEFIEGFAPARTFCLESDIEKLRERGQALGGSLLNAVVFGEKKAVNPEGLRFPDEPARHKMLDVLGDLALLGAPILGHFIGIRPGHRMTNMLLRKAMREGAIEMVPAAGATSRAHQGAAQSERRANSKEGFFVSQGGGLDFANSLATYS